MVSGRERVGVAGPLRIEYPTVFQSNRDREDYLSYLALKKILMGPSLESIERAVIKIVGRGHPVFKKICIYLSYQHSGLNLREIGEYFGMQRSAISQLSRRFGEAIKGNQELRKVLSSIEKEDLLNVAA